MLMLDDGDVGGDAGGDAVPCRPAPVELPLVVLQGTSGDCLVQYSGHRALPSSWKASAASVKVVRCLA